MSRVGERYPAAPGYKEPTTSRAAAEGIAPRAEHLRDRVLTAIANAGFLGLTPDECATLIGEEITSVRPRFTELSVDKKITKTGDRRANASGAKANVWRACAV